MPDLTPIERAPLDELTLAGQRRINLIWEFTQSFIAISVVLACLIVGVHIGVTGQGRFPEILSNAAFLILGFYYSRTNHAAIGGVGPKPIQQKYEGR